MDIDVLATPACASARLPPRASPEGDRPAAQWSAPVEVRLSSWPGGEVKGVVIASFRELDALVDFERQVQRFRLHQLLAHAPVVLFALDGREDG